MWPKPQETVNLVKFTEEIFNGKLIKVFCFEVMDHVLTEIKDAASTEMFRNEISKWKPKTAAVHIVKIFSIALDILTWLIVISVVACNYSLFFWNSHAGYYASQNASTEMGLRLRLLNSESCRVSGSTYEDFTNLFVIISVSFACLLIFSYLLTCFMKYF